jgi:hypothetical protein
VTERPEWFSSRAPKKNAVTSRGLKEALKSKGKTTDIRELVPTSNVGVCGRDNCILGGGTHGLLVKGKAGKVA